MSDERSLAVENLCRSVDMDHSRLTGTADNDGFTLDGYAAVFNTPTRIDSWEGTFDEVIAPGAFRKTVSDSTRSRRFPKLQFDHGTHPMIGSIPIGSISTLAEDDHGLHVTARLTDNWLMQIVRDGIAEGTVDGMSFRFTVVNEEWRDTAGKIVRPADVPALLWDESPRGPLTRTLKEVKVPELGPVVWPAYPETSVGVRSKVTIDLGRLNEVDQRRLLARAVFAAEAHQRSNGQTETADAPPVTAPAADSHAPGDSPLANDTPQATDTPSAGEHVTATPRGMRPIDIWVRKARDTVLTFDR